jgi:hypothetical protein
MEQFKDRIAFAAVIRTQVGEGEKRPFGLGVVEEDEPGYYPYRGPSYESFETAQAAATTLNERLGLSEREAALIVASSMRSDWHERRRARERVLR